MRTVVSKGSVGTWDVFETASSQNVVINQLEIKAIIHWSGWILSVDGFVGGIVMPIPWRIDWVENLAGTRASENLVGGLGASIDVEVADHEVIFIGS